MLRRAQHERGGEGLEAVERGFSPATRRIVLFVALAAAARAVSIAVVPLLDDEAYYWEWSRHLAWSYFDHPGMVAWWIGLTTGVGGATEWAVRAGAWAAWLGVLAFAAALARDLFGHRDHARLLLLLHAVPLFALAGLTITPDAPLALFWSAALWLFWRAASPAAGRGSWLAWTGAGLATGGALLSKYTAVFLPIQMGLWLLADPRARRWLRRPEPYVAAAISAIATLPIWIWNRQHEWASFGYQIGSRIGGPPRYGRQLVVFAAGQVVAYSPVIFPFLLAAIVWGWREARRGSRECRFLLWMALPQIAAFSIASCATDRARVHWTAPGYFTAALLAAEGWRRGGFGPRGARALRAGCWITVAVMALVIGQTASGLLRLPSRLDPALQVAGWHEVGLKVAELRERLGDRWLVAVPRYTLAGQLAFYTPGRPDVVSVGPEREQYDLWYPVERLEGAAFIYVAHDRYRRDPTYLGRFTSVERLPSVAIERAGRTIRTYRLYLCRGFHSLLDSAHQQ